MIERENAACAAARVEHVGATLEDIGDLLEAATMLTASEASAPVRAVIVAARERLEEAQTVLKGPA